MAGVAVHSGPAVGRASFAGRLPAALLTDERFRLVRYFVSGVAISTGYTVTVMVLVELLRWMDPVAASTLSFVIWTPVSYAVHRDFTFRFRGDHFAAAVKFLLAFVARLAGSAYVVYLATELLGWNYMVGVLANWIVLPLINYLVLSLWVFRTRRFRTG